MDEQPVQPEQRVVRCSDGRLRQCKARANGWTAKRRGIFIDHLAATSNVTASAREAGMNPRSAFRLRERDPQFADEWDGALGNADARLDGKLIVYAETRGKTEAAEGEEADELAGFDPQLALQLLSLHRDRRAGRQRRRGGPRPRVATEAEVEAAVLKVLKKVEKRLAKEAR
jgi:hypothetical protein